MFSSFQRVRHPIPVTCVNRINNVPKDSHSVYILTFQEWITKKKFCSSSVTSVGSGEATHFSDDGEWLLNPPWWAEPVQFIWDWFLLTFTILCLFLMTGLKIVLKHASELVSKLYLCSLITGLDFVKNFQYMPVWICSLLECLILFLYH